jgi:hypothetical protein
VIDTIYVENGVGRIVTQAINLFRPSLHLRAEFQADVHKQMQRPQRGDEWWIRDVTARGMAILTQDRAILADPDERQAIIDNKAIVIALGRAEYSVWDKFRCLARHWDLVEDLLTEDGPAAAVLWLSRNQLEKF